MIKKQNPFKNNNIKIQNNQPQKQSLSISSISNPNIPQQQQIQKNFKKQKFKP